MLIDPALGNGIPAGTPGTIVEVVPGEYQDLVYVVRFTSGLETCVLPRWLRRGAPEEGCTMTEADWDVCADPQLMLVFLRLRGKVSGRQVRLFTAACCRRIWRLLEDERSREAVLVLELFADGKASWQECQLAGTAADLAAGFPPHDWGWNKELLGELATPTNRPAANVVRDATQLLPGLHRPQSLSASDMLEVAYCVARGIGEAMAQEQAASVRPERGGQAALLRDIVGNPFRAVRIEPDCLSWNEGAVLRLAQPAYEERQLPSGLLDNNRLAVLADALEEGGCGDAQILRHLRCGGEHVRGCHVIDAILGKS
jgi:hypothetical protein